ncbi:MAG: hypothetical protein KDD29_08615, partial [Flavobacteriales bacterium]|nr:hypothetical protein [Flavobacteriales bacterium]
SDWLLNSFDESAYNFYTNLPEYDYTYFHKKGDPPSLKRKKVVGESYLYNIPSDGYPSFRYGYSYIGYQQISFRIIKTKIDESIIEYWGIEK